MEKITREVRFVVHPSLYDKFKDLCDQQYTTISEALRAFMSRSVREEQNKSNKD